MDEFDFTDGLKIVLVSIFLLGSVQLHALIDESTQHAEDRAQRLATTPANQDREARLDPLDGTAVTARTLPLFRS